MEIFHLTLTKPLPTAVTITPCHRIEKLEFRIKWLGYLNHPNTWKPEDHSPPTLVEEYFNNFRWRTQHRLMQSYRHLTFTDPVSYF